MQGLKRVNLLHSTIDPNKDFIQMGRDSILEESTFSQNPNNYKGNTALNFYDSIHSIPHTRKSRLSQIDPSIKEEIM